MNVPVKVNVSMNHCLSWLRLEVGCRILTGRGVKLNVPVWPHTLSTTFQKASIAKDGGTEAGSYGLSMRLYILPPDSTSCWPCLLLFPLAWSPGSCDLFQLGQQAGEDVCVSLR